MIVLTMGVMGMTAVGFGLSRVIFRLGWEMTNKEQAAMIEKVTNFFVVGYLLWK